VGRDKDASRGVDRPEGDGRQGRLRGLFLRTRAPRRDAMASLNVPGPRTNRTESVMSCRSPEVRGRSHRGVEKDFERTRETHGVLSVREVAAPREAE
jgi:hypothetical protein